MNINFLDTSAVLNGAYKRFENVYISPIVLMELENIKTSQKDEKTKYLARQAVRDLITSKDIHFISADINCKKKFKKYPFLQDIHDHWLIAEAAALKNYKDDIFFMTADGAQFLIAKQIPEIQAIYLGEIEQPHIEHTEYCGWGKYYPTTQQMAQLYQCPTMNTLKCQTNSFAEIFVGEELKDVLFWNGHEYTPLNCKDIKNVYTGEVIKPRNLEQKMAIHLLQNQDIKVKLLTSAWGSGKTLLALNYALEQVARGRQPKITFIRNNIIVADTKDIGFVPGDVRQKMSMWGGVIADHLGGQMMLDQLIDDGIIEIFPISHIRGRSIKGIIFCDECENLNDKLVTLLLSRVEEGGEIIFCGDVAQIDSPRFEQNNGIRAMLDNLVGDPLFGTVKLLKSERGPIPQLCDKIIPPR